MHLYALGDPSGAKGASSVVHQGGSWSFGMGGSLTPCRASAAQPNDRAGCRRSTLSAAVLWNAVRMGRAAPPPFSSQRGGAPRAFPARVRRGGPVQADGASSALWRRGRLGLTDEPPQSEVLASLYAETDAASGAQLRRTVTHPAGHRPLPPGRDAAAVVSSARTFLLEQLV